jgi:formate/nitrite transporter FocA (FNT family)
MSDSQAMPGKDILDVQPEQIAERAAGVGLERLDRSLVDILITATIGGIEVSLGGLAAMLVLGSALRASPRIGLYGGLALSGLVFPVGFFFVILGRSELFTENFLIPVAGVLRHEREAWTLAGVWGLSWVGNLAGCALMAALFSIPDALGHPILNGYEHYSAYKLSMSPGGVLVSGILAGMVMTVLTWLLLGIGSTVGKILAIFAAGYVLFATNLSHSIVGASILFVGFRLAHYSLAGLIIWILLASVGNLLGGVGLVTLFRVAQVKEKQRRAGG